MYVFLQVLQAFLASLVLLDLRERKETQVSQASALSVCLETEGYLDLQVHLDLEA